jgi:vacuolar protein-sorting-associated protein 4
MIKIHLGDTAHSLQQDDFRTMAQKTGGFSGSDISVMVRDALMEPVRRLQSATCFRRVRGLNPQGEMVDDMWEPCSPGAPGAEHKTLMDVEPSKLATPKISMGDFEKSLRTSRPSVNQDDLKKYVDWTAEFGQEG